MEKDVEKEVVKDVEKGSWKGGWKRRLERRLEKEVGKEVGVAVFGFDHSRWIASRGASNTVPPAAQANRKCEVEKHAKPLENVAFLRGEIGCARRRLRRVRS